MTGIVIVFPKIEAARNIKNILVRSGHSVTAVCSTGAQALAHADGLNDGIVICGYRLNDMIYRELKENLPEGFEILLIASKNILEDHTPGDVVSLATPLKVYELIDTVEMMTRSIERRRRQRRRLPKERSAEEAALIQRAKELLMERNNMTEGEAYRYIQKCSMDSGTNMAETARMALMVAESETERGK